MYYSNLYLSRIKKKTQNIDTIFNPSPSPQHPFPTKPFTAASVRPDLPWPRAWEHRDGTKCLLLLSKHCEMEGKKKKKKVNELRKCTLAVNYPPLLSFLQT